MLNALVAVEAFGDIHDKNAVKLADMKQRIAELREQKSLFEERIKTTPQESEQRLTEYAREIIKIDRVLDIYDLNYKKSNDLDSLLADLEAHISIARADRDWKGLVKLAKELNFEKIISTDFAEDLSEKLIAALRLAYKEGRLMTCAVGRYDEERDRQRKIDDEARSILPKGKTAEADIIARLKASSSDDDSRPDESTTKRTIKA